MHTLLKDKFEAKKVLLTTSCTAALEMAAILCGTGPGDEVILPSFTFVSTANAFYMRGARPFFVDIRSDTLNLDESKIAEAITERTKVIVPVHYAGIGCNMDAIMEIASKHNLYVVEDAAQAMNARYKSNYLGTIGDLGTFSFHETKNCICGEGGAILVNEEKGALRLPFVPPECYSCGHLFFIVLNDEATRNELMKYLKSKGIGAVFHYLPLHLSPIGRSLGYEDGQLPVTEAVSGRLLRRPLFYELKREEQDQVIESINSFFA